MLAGSVSADGAILPKWAVHGVLAGGVSAGGAILPKRAEWKGFSRK